MWSGLSVLSLLLTIPPAGMNQRPASNWKEWMLCDLQADPYEMKNLIADRAATPALAAMKKEMERLLRRDG